MTAVKAPTLAYAFELSASRYRSRVFLKERRAGTWLAHSWDDIGGTVRRLRAGLASLPIQRGERVAILAENCPQWVIIDLAVLGLGAVVVPLYPTSSAEETRHVLHDSGCCAVAVRGEEYLRKIAALCPTLPAIKTIIAMDEGTLKAQVQRPPGVTVKSMEELSGAGEAAADQGAREEIATIIYTSGTTGASKGVMLSHGNILSNCEAALDALDLNDGDEILSFLPIAHSFERTAGYYTVMAGGGTIAYAEGLGQIAQNLLQINPTVVLTVPRLLEVIHDRILRTVEKSSPARRRIFAAAMATGKRAAAYRYRGRPVPPYLALPMAGFRRLVLNRISSVFGARLRYLISGGAPLPREIFEFFSAAEVPLVEGYGLTEAAPVVAVNLLGQTRPGTVGRALRGIAVKLSAEDELLVHGPNVMQGYFHLPQETREAIDEAGWLHTGDIAAIDADGYIAIKDRKKEIIVLSNGKNVSPAALEAKLTQDSLIAQACVVGDRRKHPAALLVPNFEALAEVINQRGLAGRQPSELVAEPAIRELFQQRIRQLNRQLGDYEALGAFALVAQAFTQERGELTPTLKLRRREIARHYRQEIEDLYGG
jgi:long-chain acyl-CoA synthetase